jgi:hypothetical protein
MSDSFIFEEFPGYYVNTEGEVRNNFTLRIMTPHMNNHGVVCVSLLDRDGVQRQRSLAKLVATAFLPKPECISQDFDTPINLDYDRWNCDVDNLMWRPRWFAYQYHQQRDFSIKYDNAAPIRDLETWEVYQGTAEVCMKFGLLEKHLRRAIVMELKVFPTMQEFELADH